MSCFALHRSVVHKGSNVVSESGQADSGIAIH